MDLSEKETLLRSSEHEAFLPLAQQELKDMKYYKAVLETGKLLAEGGFEIIIGGSGIVETGNRGAYEVGGASRT